MKITLLIILFLSNGIAFATQPSVNEFSIVGRSSLTVWFFDVYDITLKTPDGKYIEDRYPLHIELTYKRDISAKKLISETLNQWRRFDVDEAKTERWADLLNQLWPDVKKDDSISFYVSPHKTTYFYFNHKYIGKINEDGFAEALSSIWLDMNGPYPNMTKELIGQNINNRNFKS